MQETWVQSLGWEDPVEEGMAMHSSILVWRIPWTKVKVFSDVMYPSKGKRYFSFKTLKHSHLDRSPSGHPALADSFLVQESAVPGFSSTHPYLAQVIRDVVGCG